MIKIKAKFTDEPKKELNNLIKKILSILRTSEIYDNDDSFIFDYNRHLSFENYFDVLLSIIYEKSNFKAVLKNKKCSIAIFDFKKIFTKIEQNKDDSELYQHFFNEIDEQIQDTNLKDYKFIFLLNVVFNDFDLNFKDLITLFGIKKLDPNDYGEVEVEEVPKGWIDLNVPFKETLKFLESHPGEKIEIKVKAADIDFALNESKFKIESFLGLISFVTNLGGTSWRFDDTPEIAKSNEYRENEDYYRICNFKSIFYIAIHNSIVINNILKNELKSLERLKNLEIIGNLKLLKSTFPIIHDHKMIDELKEYLCLYYSAISENSLDYSFLKFWVISEHIIKRGGKQNDEQMLKIINKLHNNDELKKRSEFLIKKRNKLVHEGKVGIISQSDRNLSKILADTSLRFVISSMRKINNREEFDFLIKNVNQDNKQLKRHIEIIVDLLDE